MKLGFKRFKRYLRDISIVIAGIIITFAGSALISEIRKQNEIKEVMALIRDEMKINTLNLERSIEAYQSDSVFFSYMGRKRDSFEKMPEDSMRLVQNALMVIRTFNFKTDAYELLKSASLMQNVNDKELLLKIIQGYDTFFMMQNLMKDYSDHKARIMLEPFEELPADELDVIWKRENRLKFFTFVVNDSRIWNFIMSAPYYTGNPIHEYPGEIKQTIRLLNKKYGFKD